MALGIISLVIMAVVDLSTFGLCLGMMEELLSGWEFIVGDGECQGSSSCSSMMCSRGVVVGYKQSADRDVTMTSFASPGVSTTCLSSSSLALSSSPPLSSPSFLILFSLVALQAWLVVESEVGEVCSGSACKAAVVSSVDVGDKLDSTSHM